MPSIRDLVKELTLNTAQRLCNDASYIPSEKLDWSPMDYGKSVNSILSECVSLNLMTAAAIKRESPKDIKTEMNFQALKDHVISTAMEVCKAVDTLSDDDLDGEVPMPWGAIMPAAAAIFIPHSHMAYHDGQINYIQLLLGDTKFHWAEE